MNMYSPTTLTFLVMLLVTLVYGRLLKKYQNYPPPECPINAVCAHLYGLPGESSQFLTFVSCKCPTGLYCPTRPGPQTIKTESNRWYGLCRPVAELDVCEAGEKAEDILVQPNDFDGQTYTRIRCMCPTQDMFGVNAASILAGTSSDSSEAKTIYHLMCKDEYLTKRGGRYGSGSNRRKFYFYK